MTSFLDTGPGASLLRLVSRGQVLLAEILHLQKLLPADFSREKHAKRSSLVYDFGYFKSPEQHEAAIAKDPELLAIDQALKEIHFNFLQRVYLLFDGIIKYYNDLLDFLERLQEGTLLQISLESLLADTDGRPLLVEALSVQCLHLVLLNHCIAKEDGVQSSQLRGQLLVAYMRYTGLTPSDLSNFDQLRRFCHISKSPSFRKSSSTNSLISTFIRRTSPPKSSYIININTDAEGLYKRFPLPQEVLETVLGRIKSDDIFGILQHFPAAQFRSLALSKQSATLVLLLLHMPQVLADDSSALREITDKFFSDCWIIPVFLGLNIDLFQVWEPYSAAQQALSKRLSLRNIQQNLEKICQNASKIQRAISEYMEKGEINEYVVLSRAEQLLSTLRGANSILRWLLLHRSLQLNQKLQETVVGVLEDETLLDLMLDTAELEHQVHSKYSTLLENRNDQWKNCQDKLKGSLSDLSNYFSNSSSLSRGTSDQNLASWFIQLASVVQSVELTGGSRRLQQVLTALEEVQQLHQIESSLHTKQYVRDVINLVIELIHLNSVSDRFLITLSAIRDFGYAWGLLRENNFVERLRNRITISPKVLLQLQCLFVKMRLASDGPLLHITQSNSPDAHQVLRFYLTELVLYIQQVLAVIPDNLFALLRDTVANQFRKLKDLPSRLDINTLQDFSYPEQVQTLSSAASQASQNSHGLLTMEMSFQNLIPFSPQNFVTDELRYQLANWVSNACNLLLNFSDDSLGKLWVGLLGAAPKNASEELSKRLATLGTAFGAIRKSLDFLQDFLHIPGGLIWQEELAACFRSATEQECRNFSKLARSSNRKSAFSSDTTLLVIPNPLTFLSRLLLEILNLSSPSKTMYLRPLTAWFDSNGKETFSIKTVSSLRTSIGTVGLASLDCLLSWVAMRALQTSTELCRVIAQNPKVIPKNVIGIPFDCLSVREIETLGNAISQIGQAILLKKHVAAELAAAADADSAELVNALEALDSALLGEFERGNHKSDGCLVAELSAFTESCGMADPAMKVMLTCEPIPSLPFLLSVFSLIQLQRYVFDAHLGALVAKSRKGALDSAPLLLGICCLLQHFHPSYVQKYIENLEQYVHNLISNDEVSSGYNQPRKEGKSLEVQKVTAWLDQFVCLCESSRPDYHKVAL